MHFLGIFRCCSFFFMTDPHKNNLCGIKLRVVPSMVNCIVKEKPKECIQTTKNCKNFFFLNSSTILSLALMCALCIKTTFGTICLNVSESTLLWRNRHLKNMLSCKMFLIVSGYGFS